MQNKYWEHRALETENLIQNKTDETIKKVGKLYEGVRKGIDFSINKILGTYIKTNNLTYSEALKLLNQPQTKEYRNELNRIVDRITDEDAKSKILAKLNAQAYASRISRLEALRSLIVAEAYSVGYQSEKLTEARLITTYKDSYYREHYTIQKGTGCAYDFSKISNPAVRNAITTKWKGGNYSSRIWKNTDELAEAVGEALTQGLMQGSAVAKIATTLQKKVGNTRSSVLRIIRTETAYVSSKGRADSLKDAQISKYIFIATLDLRTSSICRKLDGKIFEVAKAQIGVNKPPMHPNCRSTDGAYIEGEDRSRLQRRARNPITGENELIPQNMTYEEWYEKYVINGQNTVRAKANETAIKKYGIKKPYSMSDEELAEEINKVKAQRNARRRAKKQA